jgi:hypothetical protein
MRSQIKSGLAKPQHFMYTKQRTNFRERFQLASGPDCKEEVLSARLSQHMNVPHPCSLIYARVSTGRGRS